MSKKISFNRLFQILYPVIIYICLNSFFNIVFQILFKNSYGSVFCLMLAAIITLLPEIIILKKSPHLVGGSFSLKKEFFKDAIYIIIIVAIGILANIIVSQLINLLNSSAFDKATDSLSDGIFLIKFFTLVVFIPILEEIVFRGLVAGQLFVMQINPYLTAIFSAFLFGIFHFNIIQFLYAFIVGFVLAIAYYKTNRLLVCIIGHSILNLLVLLL